MATVFPVTTERTAASDTTDENRDGGDRPALVVELLADELAIRRVLNLYCRGVDRRDFALVRRCYTADGVDDHGKYRGSADGFVEFLRHELPERFTTTMHYVGNVVVDVDGNRADAESYVLAYCRLVVTPDEPVRDYVSGLRYVDRLRREDGWQIASRTCVFEWSRIDEVVGAEFPAGFVRGGFYPDDPVYSEPAG
jgi:hypothetical protein